MSQIISTSNYEIFKEHPSNTRYDANNLKKILNSIKVRNLLQFRPILVDNQMRVLDGNHRLKAAKALGVEVFYQIQEVYFDEDIILLNNNQKRWTYSNYCDFYISKGNQEYLKLREFSKQSNLEIASLLDAMKFKTGTGHDKFKTGGFRFVENDELAKLNDIIIKYSSTIETIEKFSLKKQKFLHSSKVKRCLFSFLTNENINFDKLTARICQKIDVIGPRADSIGYYSMFKDIYNWKNPDPI